MYKDISYIYIPYFIGTRERREKKKKKKLGSVRWNNRESEEDAIMHIE